MTRIARRMTRIKRRMTRIERRMARIERHMTRIERRMTRIQRRMTRIERTGPSHPPRKSAPPARRRAQARPLRIVCVCVCVCVCVRVRDRLEEVPLDPGEGDGRDGVEDEAEGRRRVLPRDGREAVAVDAVDLHPHEEAHQHLRLARDKG